MKQKVSFAKTFRKYYLSNTNKTLAELQFKYDEINSGTVKSNYTRVRKKYPEYFNIVKNDLNNQKNDTKNQNQINPELIKYLEKLPKNIQQLLTLAPLLKGVPAWMGPLIIEEIRSLSTKQPAWTRPKLLHPIQNEIIDCILYNKKIKIIMVDGEKRLGKSWMGWIACNEAQFNNDGMKRWFLYGSTDENAEMILDACKMEPLLYDYCRPMMNGIGTKKKVIFHSGGYLKVMASGSERQTSGTDADIIWIDESHSVLIKNPKTVAMSAMVLRAQPTSKILYTMNREGDAYEYFKNEMLENFPPEQIAHFSLTTQNCPHIEIEHDKAIRTIVRASAGEEYEAQYMDNRYVRPGGLYYPTAKVGQAFEKYENPSMELYDVIACGIDWGDSHDLAFHTMGFQEYEKNYFKGYEEETVYLQHPNNLEIERVFVRLIREFPGIIFIWETSPLGTYIRNSIREKYPHVRFIDSSFTKHKLKYIDNLYIWLVDNDLHLKDGKLKRQLRSYVNDKTNDDGHDALAHVLYMAVKARTTVKIEVRAIMRD